MIWGCGADLTKSRVHYLGYSLREEYKFWSGLDPEDEEVEIPEYCTSIPNSAFQNFTRLKKVTIPNSVTSIGDSAFSGCTRLENIKLPNSVKSMGNSTFSGCTSLENIEFPDSLTSIGDSTFYDCYYLQNVKLPSGLTSIGNSSFSYCYRLQKIELPEELTSIGNSAFYQCFNLQELILPKNLTIIDEKAFYGCSSLTTIFIPKSVTEIKGSSSFEGCSNIIFYCAVEDKPEGWGRYWNDYRPVNYNVSWEEYLSELGKTVEELMIPGTCTSIREDYFNGYENLKTVIISSSVISISSNAFSNCEQLTDVYYYGTKDKWEEIYKGDLPASKLHFMEEKEAIEPTCVLAGNKKYYIFRNEYYEDLEGKSKIEDLTAWKGKGGKGYIAPLGHNLSTTYEKVNSDSKKHYHICTVCGGKDEGEAHIWNIEEATDTEDKCCTICGYMVSDSNLHIHAGVKAPGESPTCTEPGIKDYYVCECGMTFEDPDCGKAIENLADWKVIPALGHDYLIVYFDEETHWKECNRCGMLTDKIPHIFGENESGCKECSFVKGLAIVIADGQEAYTYTGGAIKPAIIVRNYGKVLTEGVDYTVSYKNNVKVSTGAADNKKPTIIVKGKGNYSGTTQKTFEITPCPLENATCGTVTVVRGSIATPILMYNGIKLGKKDYTNPNASVKFDEDSIIELSGIGNFTGIKEVPIKVVDSKSGLKKLKVTLGSEKLYYDGTVKKISYTVRDSSTNAILNEETDYIVTYTKDLINAGTVKVTFTGINDYTGSIVKSYSIKACALPVSSFKVSGVDLSGYAYKAGGVSIEDEITVSCGNNVLIKGKDYNVTCSQNTKVGTGKYTIKFIGNYKGSKNIVGNYGIRSAVLDDSTEGLKISVVDVVYGNKPGTYVSKPVLSVDGVLVKVSDYTVTYYLDEAMTREIKGKDNNVEVTGNTPVTVYVKVNGKGNYGAGASAFVRTSYQVLPDTGGIKPKDMKITFKDDNGIVKSKFVYTGKEIRPQVLVNGQNVDSSMFDVEYHNNVRKGKATVVVKAKDGSGYVGGKSATFSIVPQNVTDIKGLWRKIMS